MAGHRIVAYRLRAADQRYLEAVARDGQLIQRVANRARALLALARGETSAAIGVWTGLSRMGLWHLWRRYEERGVDAIYDAERSGRPATLSPPPAGADRARGVHRPGGLRPPPHAVGLPQPRRGGRRASSRRDDP